MNKEYLKILDFVKQIEAELISLKKHNKKSIEKIAANFGIVNKNLIKELTELAIVNSARSITKKNISEHNKFEEIVGLYKNQVNLSHRTSRSMILQQYSTPAPISYIASLYIQNKQKSINKRQYFEPSAGNGLLTIALPYNQTTVNEIDEIRLNNLKTQPYKKILNKDASIPFTEFYHSFDGVITNPPFGTIENPVNYDGFETKTLDHLMALRTLDTMKDNGRAAIIIGGHTHWDDNGRVQRGKNRLFLNYLYSHYNVDNILLIDGHKLYSRQGTAFNTRLILIDGRKDVIKGFAPLKNKSNAEVITDFELLWSEVFEKESNILKKDNSRDKAVRIAKAKAIAKLKIMKK